MTGDGRKLSLAKPVPVQDVVWVPLIELPWRPDSKDRKPEYDQKESA